ncbi:MAG: Ppx/GppA phosphatase family protein [Pseudomonadota bacterium]
MPRENAQRKPNTDAQRRKRKPSLYAAVDLGTNNCRLLIAQRRGDGFAVVNSHSQIARLGEGLVATGELSEAAMDRAIDALTAIKRKLRHHKVSNVRCIATEACRKATNSDAFIRRVRDETGLTFKIIKPLEEVRLAAVGCHDLIDAEADLVMVLDIGGGSTEISFVDVSDIGDSTLKSLVHRVPIRAWASFPLGVVTLSEAFSHYSEEDAFPLMLAEAKTTFEQWTDGIALSEQMLAPEARMIGTSGTVTCLAGVHRGLSRYRRDAIDGVKLTRNDTFEVIQKLRDAGLEGREKLPTIGKERAGLMLSGCAILQAALDIWSAPELCVADRGLREGLLLSMMHRKRSDNGRNRRHRRKRAASKRGSAAEASNPVNAMEGAGHGE